MQIKQALPILFVTLLSACSSLSTSTRLLDQTRADYIAAQDDVTVATYAPLEMRQAGRLLDDANAAASEHVDASEVDQLAYLAGQKISSARTLAEQKRSAVQGASVRQSHPDLALAPRSQDTVQAEPSAAQLTAQLNALAAKKTERGMLITLSDALFGANQASLTPSGMETARKLGQLLLHAKERTLLVEGFSDSAGSAARNLELSQRRAEAVRNALLEMGISRARIATRGYGDAYPVANNSNSTQRQLNRRVEIVVSEEGAAIPARR